LKTLQIGTKTKNIWFKMPNQSTDENPTSSVVENKAKYTCKGRCHQHGRKHQLAQRNNVGILFLASLKTFLTLREWGTDVK